MNLIFSILFLLGIKSDINTLSNMQDLRYFKYININYRKDRGAQEQWLLKDFSGYQELEEKKKFANKTSSYSTNAAKELEKKRTDYINKYHSGEYKIDKEIDSFLGKSLKRKRQYYFPKTKIIIHHSAIAADKTDTQEEVNNSIKYIQQLHSFLHDRGDIGYNFLIDKNGKIYEGKSGGPGVIGAHTQFNNYNSVGVCLLGNFEYETPTSQTLQSLTQLIISLVRYYNIDLDTDLTYFKRINSDPYIQELQYNPIGYHSLVFDTECPGKNIISKINFIQTFVNKFIEHFPQKLNHTRIISQIRSGINIELSGQELEKSLDLAFSSYTTNLNSNDEKQNLLEQYNNFLEKFKTISSTNPISGRNMGGIAKEIIILYKSINK